MAVIQFRSQYYMSSIVYGSAAWLKAQKLRTYIPLGSSNTPSSWQWLVVLEPEDPRTSISAILDALLLVHYDNCAWTQRSALGAPATVQHLLGTRT